MKIALMIVAVLLVGCVQPQQQQQPRPPASARHAVDHLFSVSIIDLIANPEQYDGKPVRVMGFAHFEFEGEAIYLHREDFDQGLTSNGIWLDTGDKGGPAELSDQYLIVEGTFVAAGRGHLGMWSGEIGKITRMEPWIAHHGAVPTAPAQREKRP